MSVFLVFMCRVLPCFSTLEWKNEWKLLEDIYRVLYSIQKPLQLYHLYGIIFAVNKRPTRSGQKPTLYF